jgi:MSHA pilin protein MshD
VLSVVIVSVLLVGALNALAAAARARAIDNSRQRGAALAQQLMAEILQTYYIDPETSSTALGLDTGESSTSNRLTFDDVDDYHGLSNSPPKSRGGNTIANSTGWTQAVSVSYVVTSTLSTTSSTSTGLKKITVTVTDPNNKTTVLTALRASSSGLDQAPTADTVALAAVKASLQVGSDASSAIASEGDVLNRVTAPTALQTLMGSTTTLVVEVTPTN